MRWHLNRLYRVRNEIAHSGVLQEISTIRYTEHLYDYLATLVSEVTRFSAANATGSLGEIFSLINDNYMEFYDLSRAMDIRCDGFSVRLSSVIRRAFFPSPLIEIWSFRRSDPHRDFRNTKAKCSTFHFRISIFLVGQLCKRCSLLNSLIIDDIYRNAGSLFACLFITYQDNV